MIECLKRLKKDCCKVESGQNILLLHFNVFKIQQNKIS